MHSVTSVLEGAVAGEVLDGAMPDNGETPMPRNNHIGLRTVRTVICPRTRIWVVTKNHFFHRSLPRLRFMEPSGRIANVPFSSALAQRNTRSGEVKTYPNDNPR